MALSMRTSVINTSTPLICTRKLRWEGSQLQGVAPSVVPVRQLPTGKAVLKARSNPRDNLDVVCQSSRLSLQRTHPWSNRQFLARAAAVDGGPPQSSPDVVTRNDDQPLPAVEETETPSQEQSDGEHNTEHESERLGVREEDLLPFGPAGSRQYDEQDPATQLSEAESQDEGIIVKDAHLMPLPADTVTDVDRNQVGGWSESSCDDGSILYSKCSAAVEISNMPTSGVSSESLLIERLLESLPIYDPGQSAEHYRIRALVYGRIGEYFSKGEGKTRRYGQGDLKQSGTDVRMLTAMQQLADFVLAEEGRSAADYNCRAQFFKNSAEVFCVSEDKRAEYISCGSEDDGEERMEKVLQQLGDVMLTESGRSIADYNRRANVFGKTADAFSGRTGGAGTLK